MVTDPTSNPHTDHNTDNGKPFENPFGVADQYIFRLVTQIKTSRQKCRGYPSSSLVSTLTTREVRCPDGGDVTTAPEPSLQAGAIEQEIKT